MEPSVASPKSQKGIVTMNAPASSVPTTASGTVRQPATTRELLAVFLMVAGAGWNNGQFVQPLTAWYGVLADALHALPVALLIWMGLRLAGTLRVARDATSRRDGRMGLTILAVLILLSLVVFITLGLTNPDPNSVGVHSAEDWLPTIVQGSGALLWLATFIARRRHA
jgi:hypothetical protein